jgi:hypothetical protein
MKVMASKMEMKSRLEKLMGKDIDDFLVMYTQATFYFLNMV